MATDVGFDPAALAMSLDMALRCVTTSPLPQCANYPGFFFREVFYHCPKQ